MTTSVVGLFGGVAQAQAVRQELVALGVKQGAIEMIDNDGKADADSTDGASGKGFFARLGEMLGITKDDDASTYYHEGVRRGGVLIVVKAEDGQADLAVEVLQRNGAVDIDERKTATASANQQATMKSAAQTGPARSDAKAEVALPVIEEELRVGKRVVQRGGVRVYTTVTERPVEEQIRLREEHVSVQRHRVDRPVTDADMRTFKEGSFEVTERAEEAVVSKQARIVEEVVVSKQVGERTEEIRDTVRRTDVEVENVPAGAPTFETYSTDFQKHWTSSFASAGGSFEHYTPAYRYGFGLASDPRYRGASWNTFEADARRSWEEREPGTWERFKDAIKYAWEKVQRKVQS